MPPSDQLDFKKDSQDPSSLQAGHAWQSELPFGSTGLRRAASEMASSLAAGTTGAIAFSLLASTSEYGKALSIPVAMLAGGLTKYGVKTGLQDILLSEPDRTVSKSDLLWGGVDGLAGVSASFADQRISQSMLRSLGERELGANIATETAELAGKQLLAGSALQAIKYNAARGIVGGAVGSITWSLPHRTYENWDTLRADPLKGLASVGQGLVIDTAIGTAAGGLLGGGLTAIKRSPDLVGQTVAQARGEGGLLRLNEYAINDFHSNLERLPQLKTRLDELTSASTAKGIPSEFNVAGDALSGHVNFAFTNGGEVENRALTKMGLQNIIPGNHEYDAAGGGFIPERYPKMMAPILKDNPQVSLLNANLDLSAYPDYQALVKPYVVHTIVGPNGPERVATVGLITEEGAVGNIKYEDAANVAVRTVKELNGQGIKNIKLLTHLGLEEDQKLARTLLDNDLVVAKITGGHSHDITARPIWVSSKQSLVDRLQFWKPKVEIPITQGGSGGEYLSENHIVFNADGSANRWLSSGRLHPVRDVVADPELKSYIDGQTKEIGALKATTYDATTTAPYTLKNSRTRETALGNLISDATLTGLQKHLGDDGPQIAMVHSGGIRTDIPANRPLTRQELANVFMNAGSPEGEKRELLMVSMKGKDIRGTIEYGLREFPDGQPLSWAQRLQNYFHPPRQVRFDEPGNFVQVSGMKYSYDLSRQPWNRVVDMQVKMPDGSFAPMQDEVAYEVATRGHPIEKWNKFGLFGGEPQDDIYAQLRARSVPVSQVDLLGEYVRGRTLNPNIDSAVEGRITNLTAAARELPVQPQQSMVGFSTVAAHDDHSAQQKR